jgi:hypothetical protein
MTSDGLDERQMSRDEQRSMYVCMYIYITLHGLDERQMSRDEQRRYLVIIGHAGVEGAKTGESFSFSCIVGGLVS